MNEVLDKATTAITSDNGEPREWFLDSILAVDTIFMSEDTWKEWVKLSEALEDLRKQGEQHRKSTTLEKRSPKLSAKHRHDTRFKSFWSKQKSNRYA